MIAQTTAVSLRGVLMSLEVAVTSPRDEQALGSPGSCVLSDTGSQSTRRDTALSR